MDDSRAWVPARATREPEVLRPEIVQRERRDPTAATRQLQYVSMGLQQIPTWDADRAFRFGYIANVVAFRCVQMRAQALSNVPIVVGKKRGVPLADQSTSPLARLLGPPPGGPAPKLSARKLIRWTVAQQIVTGRRAWEIETADGSADGQPVAFWPLVSARLEVEPSAGGTEWFRVFRYGREGDKRTLPPGRVFYGWAPSGDDFRQAESPLQSARYDLSLVTYADRYSLSFLANNAVPAAVVVTDAFPDDDHRQRFQNQWQNEYGGPDNAGRVRFHEVEEVGTGEKVGDYLDVKVLGLSQRDAQLAEARKDALMQVAIALGTPWSKLDASGRTFDNAEVEERSWWLDTNEPDMSDLEDDINMQLAERLGSDVCWFDRSQVPALQRKIIPVTEKASVPALLMAQVIHLNEGRADYGLPPVAGGDRFLTVEEIQALKSSAGDESIRAALLALESRSGGEWVSGADNIDAQHTPPALPPVEEPDEDRGPDPEAIEARRAKIWRSTDAVVTTLETRWARAMRRLFAKQERSTLARLKGKRGRQALSREERDPAAPVDAAQVFDPAFWESETAEVVRDLYEQVTAEGLTRVAGIFGVDFDLEAPFVAELIEARANQLAGQVTSTTYEAVVTEMVAGVAEGESIDDLAQRITGVFDAASKQRAVTIARTEVISAYNGAAVAGASSLPGDVVGGQEWIATRDGRTRASHAAADGQVVAVGVPFEVGGQSLAYPGDPAGSARTTVNCRCTVAFLTPEEMAERMGAPTRMVDHRHARALLGLVNERTDLLAFRRALEAAA